MHRLVGGEAPGDLGEARVLERRDHAEVGVGRAELEPRRELEDVGLRLQRVRFQRPRVLVERLLRDRRAAELADGRDQRVAVALW